MFKTFKKRFFPYKPSSIASSRVSFLAASPKIPFFPLQERNQNLNHDFFEHDLSSTPLTFS